MTPCMLSRQYQRHHTVELGAFMPYYEHYPSIDKPLSKSKFSNYRYCNLNPEPVSHELTETVYRCSLIQFFLNFSTLRSAPPQKPVHNKLRLTFYHVVTSPRSSPFSFLSNKHLTYRICKKYVKRSMVFTKHLPCRLEKRSA
jgi:hypothetical protein